MHPDLVFLSLPDVLLQTDGTLCCLVSPSLAFFAFQGCCTRMHPALASPTTAAQMRGRAGTIRMAVCIQGGVSFVCHTSVHNF